ncbi:hypothetical protein Q1695_006382 [Nippostrongylus brasiliensis]|nr:hypothetical protein Q1695_006382 [Nippostrongylus brasiliensis]
MKLSQDQVASFNEVLMTYGLHALRGCSASPLNLLQSSNKEKSTTPPLCATCVNPLLAIRAWSLLTLVAVGKTLKAADKFICSILGGVASDDFHGTLRALHEYLEEKQPKVSCIRLFVDHQPAVPVKDDVLKEINSLYAPNKARPAFIECSFSGDDDGLASIARINNEVQESTGQRVDYVVREDNGPNRRAQMVLVSASDCTFYWRFDGRRDSVTKCAFYEKKDTDALGWIDVWPCEGSFRYSSSDGEQLLELESHIEGFKLYLYASTSRNIDARSFLGAIESRLREKSKLKVCVPRVMAVFPLKMSECTNNKGKFGFPRIFDREKSDLSGIFHRSHQFYPYFIPLWEHYHKAKFTIDPEKPKPDGQLKKKDIAQTKLSTSVERRLLKLPQEREKLSRNHYCDMIEMEAGNQKRKEKTRIDDSYVKFDTPFFFMVTRTGPLGQLVQCIGRVNGISASSSSRKNESVSSDASRGT